MQKLMIAIAGHLLTAAKNKAEHAMVSVAQHPIRQDDIYRSNMGGWN
jgi:hypothetical protein